MNVWQPCFQKQRVLLLNDDKNESYTNLEGKMEEAISKLGFFKEAQRGDLIVGGKGARTQKPVEEDIKTEEIR